MTDPDYAVPHLFKTDGPHTIASLHVDLDMLGHHGVWIESNDGQLIKIPEELRKLVAKRLREATYP